MLQLLTNPLEGGFAAAPHHLGTVRHCAAGLAIMVSYHHPARLPCIARLHHGPCGTIWPSLAGTLAATSSRRKLTRAPCATLQTLEKTQHEHNLSDVDLSQAEGSSSIEQDTSEPPVSSAGELTQQAAPYDAAQQQSAPYDAAQDWKDRFGHYGRQVHAFQLHCIQYGHLVRIWQVLAVKMNQPSNGTACEQQKPQVKLDAFT